MQLRAAVLLLVLLGQAEPGAAQDSARVTPAEPALLGLDSLLEMRISTGAKYSQRLDEVASSVTIVTADDIERYGYRTLDQVLASVPGFYTSNDRNYTYIGARGFSRPSDYNNRVLLLVDGNAVNEGVWGGAPMGADLAFPLRAVERVEIIRGPGSALYGTGAMFGVINLITRTPATLEGVSVGARAGSFGRRGSDLLLGHRFQDGTELTLSGMWERGDGPDLFYPEYAGPGSDGKARALDWERIGGVGGRVSRGDFTLRGRYGSRSKGIPTGAYEMIFNARGAETWDAYGFLELGHAADLAPGAHLATRVYYNHYSYTGDYPDATDSLGRPLVTTEAGQNRALGGEATLRLDIGSANRLTIGGEFRRNLEARYDYPRDAPVLLRLDQPSTVVSAYLQDEHQVTRAVSVLAGLRFDGHSQGEDALSPRAALIVRPARNATFKLLYGAAFRAPNMYEAGVESASYLRNPDLAPERAHTIELVWQQRLGERVLWSASLFRYGVNGLIDLTLDTLTTRYQYRNVGDANSTGVEAGFEARLGSKIHGFANYTHQRTIDEATDRRLTNSPAHLLKGGLSVRATPWLRSAVVARYESSRLTVYDTRTAAFGVADLHLEFTPGPGTAERGLSLEFRVGNLFDAEYATPGGVEHLQPAITQDGRTITVELRLGL